MYEQKKYCKNLQYLQYFFHEFFQISFTIRIITTTTTMRRQHSFLWVTHTHKHTHTYFKVSIYNFSFLRHRTKLNSIFLHTFDEKKERKKERKTDTQHQFQINQSITVCNVCMCSINILQYSKNFLINIMIKTLYSNVNSCK